MLCCVDEGILSLLRTTPRGHCLVQQLRWRIAVKCLVQTVLVVLVFELLEPFGDSRPTPNLNRVEAVSPHFEHMKPFLNVVSVAVFDPTAQL